ncbi:MAG: GGDEF domain-containing protein [Ilumatobacter sp.]
MIPHELPDDRVEARRYASALVVEAQTDADWVSGRIDDAREIAVARGWDDIDLALLHARVVHSWKRGVGSTSELLDELEDGAERIGSSGMLAIALVDRIRYLRKLNGHAPFELYATARARVGDGTGTGVDRFAGLLNLAVELEVIGLSGLAAKTLDDAEVAAKSIPGHHQALSILANNRTQHELWRAFDAVMEGDPELAARCVDLSDEASSGIGPDLPASWAVRIAADRRVVTALLADEDVAPDEVEGLVAGLDAFDEERPIRLRLLQPLMRQGSAPTAEQLDRLEQPQFGWYLLVRALRRGNAGSAAIIDALDGLNRALFARWARTRSETEDGIGAMIEAQSLARERGELAVQVITDPLTRLGNRRAWEQALDGVDGGSSTVVLTDLDWFKSINDSHGHLVGDIVLQRSAQTIGRIAAPYDPLVVARLGGDEFGVLLRGRARELADEMVAELHAAMADADWPTELGTAPTLTAGVGVADSSGEVVDAADRELYAGKRARRGRVDD